MDKKYTFTKEETKDKETKLIVKVSSDAFIEAKNKAYNKLSKDVVITGFRPGKAPRNLIEARISKELFEEALNKILPEITYEIISNEKFVPLNQVKYEVMKMSDADGVEYNAIFVDSPKIKLGDFKKIKVKKEPLEVKDDEIKAEMDKLMKQYGPKDKKEDEEVNDQMIKDMKLGFDTKDKLLEQIKIELEMNKKYQQEQKYMTDIIIEAIKISKISAPPVMVKNEAHRREHEYTNQIEKLGIKIDDFLKSQNKSMEDLKKEWDKEAERRVQEELLLYQVVKDNQISVTKEEIQKELDQIKDENTKKQMMTEGGIRYITTIILQQKALNFIKDQVNA